MSSQPAAIRTKETQILIENADSVLNQWRQLSFHNAVDSPGLEQIVRDIDRARRQFDSKLFFVVVFGPLKAGKSTLTNALAGEYVSPAGFGKETTRRPSLVVQDSESRIDQYFSTERDVNDMLSQRHLRKVIGDAPADGLGNPLMAKVRERFDEVADHLRGIRSEEEFRGRIRVTRLPFSATRLEQALTQELAAEPLLTVIRCKGGHLLSNGVAIVDMPGLDGNNSNWRADPIHEWVIERAEFFLFVQSSVAALNNETQAFLREVVAHSTKPPVWLVQNIFDARHWLPEERRKKDEEDQREEGRKRVIELLKEAPRAVFPLNVGLAWDGKSQGQDVWLAKSLFPTFEEQFAAELHAQRFSIQEGNCLRNLRQRIDCAMEQLGQIKKQLRELRTKHEQMRKELRSAQRSLDEVDYRGDWQSAVAGTLSTRAETASKLWLDTLDNELAALKERHNCTRTGTRVNTELAEVATTLAADGNSKHFTKSLLLPDYVKVADQFCKAAENDAISSCNQLLASLTLEHLPVALAPSADDLPALVDAPFTHDRLKEHPIWNRWWDTKHDGAINRAHIEAAVKGWRQQIERQKKGWINTLLTNHFSTYCEKRRKHFQGHVQRLLADFEAGVRAKEEAVTATENIVNQMIEGLRNFELPLSNANASLK